MFSFHRLTTFPIYSVSSSPSPSVPLSFSGGDGFHGVGVWAGEARSRIRFASAVHSHGHRRIFRPISRNSDRNSDSGHDQAFRTSEMLNFRTCQSGTQTPAGWSRIRSPVRLRFWRLIWFISYFVNPKFKLWWMPWKQNELNIFLSLFSPKDLMIN